MINVGIDFGTSNSCVAILGEGEPRVVPSAEGSPTTPSVVGFLPSGQRVVGVAAKRQMLKNAEMTISSAKRFLGRLLEEVEEEGRHVPQMLAASESGAVRFVIGEELISPEQVASLILAKLKADVEDYYGEELGGAVLTVPAHWGDAQRQALRSAAEAAEIEVIGIINEPTAAALAYGYGFADPTRRTIVVFDLGGGTFDISAVAVEDGNFTVLATAGNNQLGGDDFDALIVDHLIKVAAGEGIALERDPLIQQRLQEAAEQAKIELSTLEETTVSIPYISVGPEGAVHLESVILRAELEKMISPLLEQLQAPIAECLEAAQISAAEIDDVVLVGGMTRMPAVKNQVERLLGRLPKRGVDTGQAVALGAAIRVAALAGDIEGGDVRDVTPLSLGLEVITGMTEHLVAANTPLPVRITEVFSTADDNQSSVELRIVQGERSLALDNKQLGIVRLRGIAPAPAYTPQIEVVFELDESGILRVGAKDLASGVSQEAVIESAAQLSSWEAEQMRSEAAAYKAADQELRERAHLRNSARALLDSADAQLSKTMASALTLLDGALNGGDLNSLRDALAKVQKANKSKGKAKAATPVEEPLVDLDDVVRSAPNTLD